MSGTKNERPSGGLLTPLMASKSFRLPEASDGDGYDDPNNNDNDYREGRGNSACEAVTHLPELLVYGRGFGNASGGLYKSYL